MLSRAGREGVTYDPDCVRARSIRARMVAAVE